MTAVSPPSHRISAFFHRKPQLRLGLLLTAPMLWLGLAYLGALAALFITAFWSTDVFTGKVVTDWSFDNVVTLFSDSVYRTITFRTVGIALLVTVIDAVIAFPMAFAMAKLASPKAQRVLVIMVMTPLWASYLVKAYAWRTLLSGNGVLNWLLNPLGISGPGYGVTATVITLSYLWLPYMILPIYAGLERLPVSLVDASGDLGAKSFRTFRSVILPLTFPAIVAGSIFTFSLSLGDYIAVKIVGGTSQMLGNVVYDNIGAANNLPFAATVATVPVVIMLVYLAAVRRTGALDNL
ncbi:putative spermidine/putrescine transport system permease protein [Amycolatopsis echigonensis]|uniref:Spermidine/putrescine transport system permease protein n=1 Tax=Amycolatopsis echigonensis TaxID=2576905 RepID=A0A2N3WCP8_9PSEU|nr:ABC transporter permease [Amycolatopsis niigatensis]PKV91648.1 putative spermidine/putrescine transport system permease protein [Amycolatopsis niigatensis]